MLNKLLLKILNLPVIIKTRFYPRFNRLLFRLKGVTFGRNMMIMGKVSVIGARSIIGAGSVVTKSIPADCIVAGNPCRVIKKLQEKDK